MKSFPEPVSLVGYACGMGAGNSHCEQGPKKLLESAYYQKNNINYYELLTPEEKHTKLQALKGITDICKRLAETSCQLIKNKQFLVTIGGDHSCAIGTWSGVATALAPKQLGLLWIDAHLDSHTLETTPSQNIHGMPLASLLGQGCHELTHILTNQPKLLPENVCVVGARSFEPEEHNLLQRLNVKIYYMDEIKERGFPIVLAEAIAHISRKSQYLGISLDLDAIDPSEAPGVGSPEPGGIKIVELYKGLDLLLQDKRLVAAEIAEFNPTLDKEGKTEHIITTILEQIANKISAKESSNEANR